MKPLKCCFVWHFHQPDYRSGGQFYLPWVRMHATKDYTDVLKIMRDFTVKHTINLVPSLLVQLQEYEKGRPDPVSVLVETPARDLSESQKTELWQWANTLQRPTMTKALPRLEQLLLLDPLQCTVQEVCDMQALLLLAWTGPISRRSIPVVRECFVQQQTFTSSQVLELNSAHLDLIRGFIPLVDSLNHTDQFEISLTPFHHPILPLICDTNSALESKPKTEVIDPPLQAPADAHWHVAEALSYWQSLSLTSIRGMWPAEGSLSNAALDVFINNNVVWTASDEGVLKQSMNSPSPTAPYHPYRYTNGNGSISILFRDHGLSDAIGFEYSTWDAAEAAKNFVNRLLERRQKIIEEEGEKGLDDAVVSIILDGENCWEFYEENGEPFLRSLFLELQQNQHLEFVTCSEAVRATHHRDLPNLVAGSWINASFDVWIGSESKNLAWSLLREIRSLVESSEKATELMQTVYRLEASDWFWWYDERHQAPHKRFFDAEFRRQLSELYNALLIQPPIDLDVALYDGSHQSSASRQHDANIASQQESRRVVVSYGNNTMHDANAIIGEVTMDTNGNWQRITFEQLRPMHDTEEVIATITDRLGNERRCGIMSGETLFQSDLHDEGVDRDEQGNVRVYLRATTQWTVSLEEQRQDGATYNSTIELKS